MKRLEVVPTAENIEASIREDKAKRNGEIVSFIKLLDETEGPFCWMIDAAWGDGKTFFVRSVEYILKAINQNIPSSANANNIRRVTNDLDDIQSQFLPFYFNAWENDFSEDPISALFACMAVSLDGVEFTKKHDVVKGLTNLADAGMALAGIPFRLSGIAEELRGESLIEAYRENAERRERIDELAKQSTIEVADKLVIFIDELDRCRPDFAVKLLEQTKNLFQSENIIVVLSADAAQLAKAVGGMYGEGFDTQHFLERFYDRRVLLSHIDPYEFITGKHYPISYDAFDTLVKELLDRSALTIRDQFRVYEDIEAAHRYCNVGDSSSPASFVAKHGVVPLLIFMYRTDINRFRSVVNGSDYDALYEYGKQYKGFLSILNRYLSRNARLASGSKDDELTVSEEERRSFMRNLCIVIYSISKNTQERIAASGEISSFESNHFDPDVFKRLKFPDECYKAQ